MQLARGEKLKVIEIVVINGVEHEWDSFTDEEKKDIGRRLSDAAMAAAGYRPVNRKMADGMP